MSAHPQSRLATEALRLLGAHIEALRKRRGWTQANLADRTGISTETVRLMEQGDPACRIGLVFECAVLVGVPLFEDSREQIDLLRERIHIIRALMPKQLPQPRHDIDNDF